MRKQQLAKDMDSVSVWSFVRSFVRPHDIDARERADVRTDGRTDDASDSGERVFFGDGDDDVRVPGASRRGAQ